MPRDRDFLGESDGREQQRAGQDSGELDGHAGEPQAVLQHDDRGRPSSDPEIDARPPKIDVPRGRPQ
jgi:hypothetical protein